MSSEASRTIVFMRPPKITTIPLEEYKKQYWPKIQQALISIVSNPHAITFSQEEMYRNVYNVCCQRHTLQLYNDLLGFINNSYLLQVRSKLLSVGDEFFILQLAKFFTDFKPISEIIQVVFRYLDRTHIQEKLATTLKQIIQECLQQSIFSHSDIRKRIENLIVYIPVHADPNLMMNLVKGLYELDKSFASLNMHLFAVFIPGIYPSKGFDSDLKDSLEMIAALRSQGFGNSTFPLKRKIFVAETT